MNKNNSKTPLSPRTSLLNKALWISIIGILILLIHTFWLHIVRQQEILYIWPNNFYLSAQGEDYAFKSHKINQAFSNNFKTLGNKSQKPFIINLLEEGPSFRKADINISHLSQGLFRITTKNASFLIFTTEFETLPKPLPNISWKHDWWILEKTVIPRVPIPKKGILYLNNTKPGKSLLSFSKEHNKPLLQTKNTLWSISSSAAPPKVRSYMYR